MRTSAQAYGRGAGGGLRIGGPGTRDPRLIRYIDVPLERILEDTFDVTWNQISGPDWIADQRYNINARVPDHTTKDEAAEMLRSLLVERLHLAWHVQTSSLPGYQLVREGLDLKLQQSEDQPASTVRLNVELKVEQTQGKGPTTLTEFRETSTAEFAHWLGSQLGEEMLRIAGGMRLAPMPIADKTGLGDRYDFTFEYGGMPFLALSPEGAARNLTAIQKSLEKLGLKLVKARVEVKNVIIDHIDRAPAEN